MHVKSTLLVALISLILQITCRASQKTINLPLKATHDGQLFYVQVEVGPAKARQTFNMVVSTLYDVTWLPSVEVSPTRGYNRTDSSQREYDSDRVIYRTGGGLGKFEYFVHNDTWLIGSHSIEQQPFGVVYPTQRWGYFGNQSNLDGILGLNGHACQPARPNYLFRNLFRSKLIDELKFSLYINNTANQQDTSRGALVFGGVDKRYFTGNFTYANLTESHYPDDQSSNRSLWFSSIQMDWSRTTNETKSRREIQTLATNDSRIDLTSPGELKLDSSAKLFVGQTVILDKIQLDFIGATNIGSTSNGRAGPYIFDDCRLDNKPDLVFLVEGIELVVAPEDYVVEDELDGRQVCISAFKGHRLGVWVVGTRFLRKFYTLFDYENDVVGFATPRR